MAETEDSSENLESEAYNPKVRWVIPDKLDMMTFVGKEVLAVAHDIYIIFLNLRTHTELVYVANSEARGDGVDAISGHGSNMFAFAEKVKNPRIFIVTYPTFNIMVELKDVEVSRYKGLCMMEGDLVAGFSGFPEQRMVVWSWRTGQRLLAERTRQARRRQLYAASRTHMLVCQCGGGALAVWELAPCYRRCLLIRRDAPPASPPAPHYGAVCWAADGALYALDERARLYGLTSDGIDMVAGLEWEDAAEAEGEGEVGEEGCEPCMCALGAGVLVAGPGRRLRWLKKVEQRWTVVWQRSVQEAVVRLVSNAAADAAAAWGRGGTVLRLAPAPAPAPGPAPGPAPAPDSLDVTLFCYKQRHITKMQLLAPDCDHVATMNDSGVLCVYELMTAKLVNVKYISGVEVSFEASPVEPLLAVFGARAAGGVGEAGAYGVRAVRWADGALRAGAGAGLTRQRVSRAAFAPAGRHLVAAAMDAGHIFVYKVSPSFELTLVRHAELGRALAACALAPVGDAVRVFSLVRFSDKYLMGERIMCVNAETGKDNKLAGKMQGPYEQLLPLRARGALLAVPRLARAFHVLLLAGEKGSTVTVRMGAVVETGHQLRQFSAFRGDALLLTCGADGAVTVRRPDAPPHYDLRLVVSHRYGAGVAAAAAGGAARGAGGALVALSGARALVALQLRAPRPAPAAEPAPAAPPAHEPPPPGLLDRAANTMHIIADADKTYLELMEERRVREEAQEHAGAREEARRARDELRLRLARLLDRRAAAPPAHCLPLHRYLLHRDQRQQRLAQAEKEREEIRLQTEARIRAQDRVAAWVSAHCWRAVLAPCVKLFAIFAHYQVENYPVLPTQREQWPELQQTLALRGVEMDNDHDLLRPWREPLDSRVPSLLRGGATSAAAVDAGGAGSAAVLAGAGAGAGEAEGGAEGEAAAEAEARVLAGSAAHRYVAPPPAMLPQLHAYSYLQMNWLQHLVKLNVQNMRQWFNKQFDELMALKRREVALVAERNARLRFIVEELNKLSDLRGSFHHLLIQIRDPEWRQEEQPHKLIKVEPEECSVAPYVSPSQQAAPAPARAPPDDFRERALLHMMDGVLEKLWHEEIKKPIPPPQCMLDKEPEHWSEEELRQVFEHEALVAAREAERGQYRRMLHAEHARLAQLLADAVARFNQRVKETWLTRLQVDSVIGQENLNLMRLRRENLDRLEAAEQLEDTRAASRRLERALAALQAAAGGAARAAAGAAAALQALERRARALDRAFLPHFADLAPVALDQCSKFFKKRPKWHQRASMTPAVLGELAAAVLAGARPPLLHPDCLDYYKAVEQLDQPSNMPAVLDEALWADVCRLRRAKIDNEIRVRALVQEAAAAEGAAGAAARAGGAGRAALGAAAARAERLRAAQLARAQDRALQLVLPAGQVEVATTGHSQDFEDAALVPRDDIEAINNLILKVGAIKLAMMRKQITFRKVILAKEWEHAQMKMKLRHMHQELSSYRRLKIPKELQRYLKEKELGHSDEQDYVRLEKEMAATRRSVDRVLAAQLRRAEELEVKISELEAAAARLEQLIVKLHLEVSEKRLHEDPLDPIRVRRIFKKRLETLAARSRLVRAAQRGHARAALLHTELELLRLKTYPTLASFRTFC